MPSTYKDIQKLTGFSLSTISRYFNGENVKAPTKDAIEKAAKQLDFKINDFARGLRSKKAMTVGLLIPSLQSMFSATIMHQVGKLLRQQGYGCFVCDSNNDLKVEKEVIDFFIGKSVDGIISIPFDPDPQNYQSAKKRGIPTVFINRNLESFDADAVIIDNYKAGKMASEHLLTKGHKKTAIIASFSRFLSLPERLNGYLSTYPKSGDAFSTEIIRKNNTIYEGNLAIKELFASPNDISAIFCTNYELTLGAFSALRELGIKFPEDISFIGFDKLQMAEVIRPALTIVEQPMEEIAIKAVELLLERIKSGESAPPRVLELNPKLTLGNSVADLS